MPFFLETLTYNGLISFKYFCITSVENLFDDDDEEEEEDESVWMLSLCFVFLRLEALVNIERFEASSTLNLIVKSLFCFLVDSVFSITPVFSVLSVAIDLGFLNIATRSFGADLSREIGDWAFKLELELGSIGKIFLLDKTSVEDKEESVAVAVCCWLSLLLVFFLLSQSETVSSNSKNESSPSSNSLSEQTTRLGAASTSMSVAAAVVSLSSLRA